MCSALKESCQVSFRICHSNASNETNYCPQTTQAGGAGVTSCFKTSIKSMYNSQYINILTKLLLISGTENLL